MKIALVHDWLIHMRGGEKVLASLREIFPEADIFTLFHDRKKLSGGLEKATIHASFLQYLPGIRRYYRWLLPLFPLAVRTLPLEGYDLIISSSHCVAKGCPIPPGALHVCYCHTPVRYVWGFREEYFQSYPVPVRKVIHWILDRFRKWDLESNRQVHFFIANSENTRKRIEKFYNRDAAVIYPPVDVDELAAQGGGEDGGYYLIVSALVPYKRIDLAIRAFNQLGYPLRVIGEGPEGWKLKRAARPPIEFLGSVSGEELSRQYRACRALIFPGEEDFGIVPVEAQACGKPVIAYARGGALETVSGGTGVFFQEPTPEALIQAVRRFESLPFHSEIIKEAARRFDRRFFQEKVRQMVGNLYDTWQGRKAVASPSKLATK